MIYFHFLVSFWKNRVQCAQKSVCQLMGIHCGTDDALLLLLIQEKIFNIIQFCDLWIVITRNEEEVTKKKLIENAQFIHMLESSCDDFQSNFNHNSCVTSFPNKYLFQETVVEMFCSKWLEISKIGESHYNRSHHGVINCNWKIEDMK